MCQTPSEARYLLSRTRDELSSPDSHAIIDMVTTIMAYRFENLSRMKIESMLDITLKETRVYQEIKQEGREEGRKQEAVNFVTRQLTKRFGELPLEVRSLVSDLSVAILEELGEALLDFTSVVDLEAWLQARIN